MLVVGKVANRARRRREHALASIVSFSLTITPAPRATGSASISTPYVIRYLYQLFPTVADAGQPL
jgi:hypothetical protein